MTCKPYFRRNIPPNYRRTMSAVLRTIIGTSYRIHTFYRHIHTVYRSVQGNESEKTEVCLARKNE